MIQRIGVPVTSGGPGDVNAWWNLPATRAAAKAYPVQIPPDAEWIALDPGNCTPNVQIAVDVPGAGLMLMVPGATIPVPKKSRPVFVHNPLIANGGSALYPTPGGGVSASVLFGRISMLCGDTAALPAWLAYCNRFQIANPKTGAIFRGAFAAAGGTYACFPTTGLRALRISASGADAGGVPLGVQPADFSVVIAFAHDNSAEKDALVGGDPLDMPLSGVSPVPHYGLAATKLTLANPDGFSQFADVAVTVPARALGIYTSALAGTGVTTALITVEGVPVG